MESPLKSAISGNLPFVIYRLPDQKKVNVAIQQNKALPFYPFDDIDNLRGFLVAPFRGKNINELICLKPDHQFVISEDGDKLIEMTKDVHQIHSTETDSGYVLTKDEYLKRADYLIEVLKSGDLRKIVLSRVLEHPLPSAFNWAVLFQNLLKAYPKAFVYYTSLPGFGSWIGATPETLLSIESDHAETVALAGTQPADKFNWTEKEIKEQQIVMDYIEELLYKNGITEYGRTEPFTVKAGNMVHLKTRYNLSLDQIKGKVGKIIADLHPTPAVCGLPRNKSYKLIRKVEKHDRGFYTGFLGPWNLSGESKLYVNLRCAELHADKMSLYVGGGLTSESVAEAEWQETIRKSETLLSVVEIM